MEIISIIIGVVALLIGAAIGYFLSKKSVDQQNQILIDTANTKAKEIVSEAEREGEAIKKEKIFQAKEKFLELKAAHEESVNQRERKIADARSEEHTSELQSR